MSNHAATIRTDTSKLEVHVYKSKNEVKVNLVDRADHSHSWNIRLNLKEAEHLQHVLSEVLIGNITPDNKVIYKPQKPR